MISNERPSRYGKFNAKPFEDRRPAKPSFNKPAVPEDSLCSQTIQAERKTFIFTLKENPRGRFLRITEEAAGRKNSIMIPASDLVGFQQALEKVLQEPNA